MALKNFFRRENYFKQFHSLNDISHRNNSIEEILFDELELQCRSLFIIKRKSETVEKSPTTNTNKRNASVDYSWLNPSKTTERIKANSYHLSEMVKLDLSESMRHVFPEDCQSIINEFRRQIRLQHRLQSPENVIGLFRKTVADHVERKMQRRSDSSDDVPRRNSKRFDRFHLKSPFEDDRNSSCELTQTTFMSISTDDSEGKPRSNTVS